jgi:uncharacterized protein YjiS (DUF1127 family)
MSIITLPGSAAEHEAQASPRAGLLQRIVAAVLESRRLSTQRRVAVYLEGLSEQRLADLDSRDARIVQSALSRIVAGMRTYRASLAEHRRIRRAQAELAHLDDRMLKDIGVTRSQIRRVARYGRDI